MTSVINIYVYLSWAMLFAPFFLYQIPLPNDVADKWVITIERLMYIQGVLLLLE